MSPTTMTVLELLTVGLLLAVGYVLGRGHRQERERVLRRQLTAIQRVVGEGEEAADLVALAEELAAARDFYAAFHHWWDEHQGSMVAVLDAERAYEQAAGR